MSHFSGGLLLIIVFASLGILTLPAMRRKMIARLQGAQPKSSD